MIYLFLITFFTSLTICYYFIRFSHFHLKYSFDNQEGPQKIHQHTVSRIGGISILLSLISSLIFNAFYVSKSEFLFETIIYLMLL